MSRAGAGALAGLSVAMGLLLLAGWVQARRPLPVARRIAPYVGGQQPVQTRGPVALAVGFIMRPGIGLGQRLARAGTPASASSYRLEQVAWGACGAFVGGLVAVIVLGGTPASVLVLAVAGSAAGALGRDWRLGRQAAARRERIERALPSFAELLAFSVAAGESPFAALARGAAAMPGDLADEIGTTLADVRSGHSLDAALRACVDRTGSARVERLVDGLLLALERGTPLVGVLRAQAADALADERRWLMELAGRKDVLMLVPVVFLVLPTVIAVAVFPGLQGLGLVAP